MSNRAVELAQEFLEAVAEFRTFVQEIPDATWAIPLSSGDPRGIGVVARHIVWGYEFEWKYFLAIANGRPLPPVPEFKSINAEYAKEWTSISKADVLQELQSADAVADQIGKLTDEQLARQGMYAAAGSTRTVAEWIERPLKSHIRGHMAEIRAAVSI